MVRLYPARFREQFGDEMVVLFADQLREARTSKSRLAVPLLWARSLADLVLTVPTQHLSEGRRVPQTVEPDFASATRRTRPPRRFVTFLAATPMLMWAFMSMVTPGFTDPIYQNPPGILVLPMGILLVATAVVLAVLGVLTVRAARTGIGVALSLAFLTIPAAALLIAAPMLILVIQVLPV